MTFCVEQMQELLQPISTWLPVFLKTFRAHPTPIDCVNACQDAAVCREGYIVLVWVSVWSGPVRRGGQAADTYDQWGLGPA